VPQLTHARSTGGIRRGPRRADNFTVLSNAVLNDERLSFRARGVLMWLLSKPLDWSVRSEAIAGQSPREGREAIRTAMRELAELGYLVREKVQDERGRWSTIQTVHEEPATGGHPSPDPGPGKPVSGRATAGKPGALTKNRSPRTDTNHHPHPSTKTARAARERTARSSWSSNDHEATEVSVDDRDLAALEAATLAAGLPASYARVRPKERGEILALIGAHGVDRLVDAAKQAHRPSNPTMHVHGWIRLWSALALPRRHTSAPRCAACEGTGFVLNDEDLAVRCVCRHRAAEVPVAAA